MDKEKSYTKIALACSANQKAYPSSYTQNLVDTEEKVSPPRRKGHRDEKSEKLGNSLKTDASSSDTVYKQQNTSTSNLNNVGSSQYKVEMASNDANINEILEEEEALIAAHRKEIEDTMEIVCEEMKLLAEVDRPGSLINNYVTQLNFVLSRKAASLVSLQAVLLDFSTD